MRPGGRYRRRPGRSVRRRKFEAPCAWRPLDLVLDLAKEGDHPFPRGLGLRGGGGKKEKQCGNGPSGNSGRRRRQRTAGLASWRSRLSEGGLWWVPRCQMSGRRANKRRSGFGWPVWRRYLQALWRICPDLYQKTSHKTSARPALSHRPVAWPRARPRLTPSPATTGARTGRHDAGQDTAVMP